MTLETPSYFELMGGQPGIRKLVDTFYDFMDTAPEASQIRVLHPASLDGSREKLYLFLVGWSGGPPLYTDQFGHPRLRMRHQSFVIGAKERDQWMWCMNHALDESDYHPQVIEYLKGRFAEIADAMKNKRET